MSRGSRPKTEKNSGLGLNSTFLVRKLSQVKSAAAMARGTTAILASTEAHSVFSWKQLLGTEILRLL